MSKHKKHQQKNMSLKERLAKHWGNRNWDNFVSLFLRDREASMRTTWANSLNAALYNSLTQALFVDRNFQNAVNTLALIETERSSFKIPDWLADCADVASDFLKARNNTFLNELTPLKAESDLPANYASLRKGMLSFISPSKKERKAQKNEAASLVDKFADQFSKLKGAKTTARYTTILKTTELLVNMSKGTGNESIFQAIHAIIVLIREIHRTGKGENTLRDPKCFLESNLFQNIPYCQTNPAVRALWEFFCRAGERKYGVEWGEAARIFQLSFIVDKSQNTLKTQYLKLIKLEPESPANLMQDIIRSSSNWTEQELYIINSILVATFDCDEELGYSLDMQFLNAFDTLTRIGRKWRPEAPWTNNIRNRFNELLNEFPINIITSTIKDIPYDLVSPYALVMLSLMDAEQLRAIEKNASKRLPLRLNEEEIYNLEKYAIHEELPRQTVQVIEKLFDRAESVSIMTRIVCRIVMEGAMVAIAGGNPSTQPWNKFSRKGLPEKFAAALPPDNFAGCFCRLCSGVTHNRISNDTSKIEAFFAAMPPGTEKSDYAAHFMAVLLTWHNVPTEFLVRLFKKTFFYLDTSKIRRAFFAEPRIDLNDLAHLIGRMTNKEDRKAVALGILELIRPIGRSKGGYSFKTAIRILERSLDVNNAKDDSPNTQEEKSMLEFAKEFFAKHCKTEEVMPVYRKAKKNIEKKPDQGTLPFED